MKLSRNGSFMKHYGMKIVAVCFWLVGWEILSITVDKEFLIASPPEVLVTLLQLAGSGSFWQTIFFSFARIVTGFIIAVLSGAVLAVLSYKSLILRELVMPLMKVIRSIPVASFIILALVWIRSVNLSVLISFLMVLPIIYINFFEGLKAADRKLL
jgi:NitT/TauT family transport system permease protein